MPTSSEPAGIGLALPTLPGELTAELNSIPPKARVLLEGGNFTIQVRRLPDGGRRPDTLPYLPNAGYLLYLPRSDGPVKYEVAREPDDTKDGLWDWSFVVPPEGCSVPLTGLSTSREVHRVDYVPSASQLATWKRVLDLAAALRGRVASVGVGVFVGDLHVPPPVRSAANAILPTEYTTELKRRSLDTKAQLFSEAYCRNVGKRRALRTIDDTLRSIDAREQAFREYGYAAYRNPLNKALYLSSDTILSECDDFPYLVAITKDRNVPSCGLIIAGKFAEVARRGYTHFLSNYDRSDDPNIRRKNIDGAMIASHLMPKVELHAILWTTEPMGNSSRQRFESYDFRRLRGPGSYRTVEELIEHTLEMNRLPGLHVANERCPVTCSPTPPARSPEPPAPEEPRDD